MPGTTHAVGTTAAEAEVLAATQAAIAAGKDPFGDDDADADAETAADDDGAENSAAAALSAGESTDELTAEQLAAIAAEGEDGEGTAMEEGEGIQQAGAGAEEATQEPAQRQYRVDTPEAMAAAKKELRAKKNQAFKDYSDGVIDAEEFSRIDDEVAEALEQLTVQRTLHTANVQAEAETTGAVLDGIIKAAKTSGEIDYRADASAAAQFDAAMTMIAADGKQRTYAQLADEAHKAVLSARGITPKAPKATKEDPKPAEPRENGKGPLTLRNVPAASVPNTGGTWQDQLAKLSGQAYEEAYAALTPAQKASLLND